MLQEQLVEYIKGQLKLGVSREAVKSALVGAGWVPADVEETMKKVEADAKPAPAFAAPAATNPATMNVTRPASSTVSPVSSSPAMMSTGGAGAAAAGGTNASAQKLPPDLRSIKISDLVSANSVNTNQPVQPASSAAPPKDTFFKGFSNKTDSSGAPASMKSSGAMTAAPAGATASPAMKPAGGSGRMTMALGVLTLIFAGAAGYLFYDNIGLRGTVSSLGGQSSDVSDKVNNLSYQLQGLLASDTQLTAEVISLQKENNDLKTNLSFLLLPAGTIGGTPANETVSVSGPLKQKAEQFSLTTVYGVTVYVKNSTDPLVIAALKPLVASSTVVTLAGTHATGSQFLTVTSVNGNPLVAAKPATTSTTSTATTTP